jgi:hypothetical protein
VAIGFAAGGVIETGDRNVVIGSAALDASHAATTSVVVIGCRAADAINSTAADGTVAIGDSALTLLTDGIGNTAIGYKALENMDSGDFNTAVGYQALQDNTQDATIYNTAVGYQSALNLTTGTHCTAIGAHAIGAGITTGAANTAIGAGAGYALVAATQNTFVGKDAGVAVNAGNGNVCIGYLAGDTITDGDHNVCIGNNSDTASGNDYSIAIGYGISAATNEIRMGASTYEAVYTQNDSASWSTTSDERIKKDIATCDLGLTFINDLRPVTFKRKAYEDWPEEIKDGREYNGKSTTDTDKINYGFVAQEVKKAIDNHGHSGFPAWSLADIKTGRQGVGFGEFVIPLVKAVQELTAKVKALEDAQ